ncbi:MAG: transcription-repair coupling factor [Bacteroidales bacterium]|nr:transcription-repair coupling factor [Bacteroidales bacterium]
MATELKKFKNIYESHPLYNSLIESIKNKDDGKIHLKGLSGSSASLLISKIIYDLQNYNIFILSDKEEAAYFYNDLLSCTGSDSIMFFPSSYKRTIQYEQTDNGNIILRTHALNKISAYSSGLLVLVTYPEALAEAVIGKQQLQKETLNITAGEKLSTSFIKEVLDEYQFELVDFVYEPGQYALRGSIIDIFSFAEEYPFRIDFFGDEVESIRSFEVESQLSVKKYGKINILPNLQEYAASDINQSFLDFTEIKPCIWCNNTSYLFDQFEEIIKYSTEKKPLIRKEKITRFISLNNFIEFGTQCFYKEANQFSFNTKQQPVFQKNFNLLGDNLKLLISQKFETYILSENEKQIERLRLIFQDTHQGIPFKEINQTIHQGFIDEDLKFALYTDHQIFDRYHKYRLQKYFSSKASVSINELKYLNPGDYVVHVDHGVGKFGGLEKIEENGKIQEKIKLVYRDNDVLYVNIHSLHRISKYKGKDDTEPKIYKLGTGAWQKLKENTKRKVKDIAKDLIMLYAKRKEQEGFQFSADTYLQEELEASFIYEDTPDQLKATVAVKKDMESKIPMDRLICGDVGFGKTEVAIRASFKAVTDSKQVVVLVPTTILALQHFTTFRERLKDFPCRIEHISRLKKPAEQKKILADVEKGLVDIIIGTHRLLGKDIHFKDLGLLIIDEEQKFGVAAKEKLKNFRINVDALTMTATPIPRTLQFSLMGARDLSVINTPPPNRNPIVTELHTFNESIFEEGINFEVSRGGQVFVIHNRIQNIYEVEALINKICPGIKTAVGHGQLEGSKLEKVMIDFMNGDYDVLIATSIVESGLDIPNANTIYINDAQNFGLSDLHQLRGRVGRSNKRAFCYLIAPPLVSVSSEARRRLKAIEEFSDLGSGLNIALQDLDIRGAGNMLGAEQSGFIADIGFETYNRILNEALLELKAAEFKDLFLDEEVREAVLEEKDQNYTSDCIIDTDLGIHIPETYVSNISERIRLYRKLDSIETDEELINFRNEITDRFGPIPPATEELLKVVQLRWLAQKLGYEKIIIKNNKFIGYFTSNQNSSFYSSPVFQNILTFVQQNEMKCRMKEGADKLTLTIENITDIDQTYRLMLDMNSTWKL